jgi:hypothetical protein
MFVIVQRAIVADIIAIAADIIDADIAIVNFILVTNVNKKG